MHTWLQNDTAFHWTAVPQSSQLNDAQQTVVFNTQCGRKRNSAINEKKNHFMAIKVGKKGAVLVKSTSTSRFVVGFGTDGHLIAN